MGGTSWRGERWRDPYIAALTAALTAAGVEEPRLFDPRVAAWTTDYWRAEEDAKAASRVQLYVIGDKRGTIDPRFEYTGMSHYTITEATLALAEGANAVVALDEGSFNVNVRKAVRDHANGLIDVRRRDAVVWERQRFSIAARMLRSWFPDRCTGYIDESLDLVAAAHRSGAPPTKAWSERNDGASETPVLSFADVRQYDDDPNFFHPGLDPVAIVSAIALAVYRGRAVLALDLRVNAAMNDAVLAAAEGKPASPWAVQAVNQIHSAVAQRLPNANQEEVVTEVVRVARARQRDQKMLRRLPMLLERHGIKTQTMDLSDLHPPLPAMARVAQPKADQPPEPNGPRRTGGGAPGMRL